MLPNRTVAPQWASNSMSKLGDQKNKDGSQTLSANMAEPNRRSADRLTEDGTSSISERSQTTLKIPIQIKIRDDLNITIIIAEDATVDGLLRILVHEKHIENSFQYELVAGNGSGTKSTHAALAGDVCSSFFGLCSRLEVAG
jgi:hypothetical protein